MTTWNDYNIWARNLEKKLEKKELNGMAELQEVKRSMPYAKLPKIEIKLLQRTKADPLDNTGREERCSMKFVD